MTNGKTIRRRRRGGNGRRGEGGGLLVLSVCIIVLFLLIVAPFFFFMGNLSTQIVVTDDSRHIAKQAAGIVDDYRLWLDAPRPGYDQSKAFETARVAATAMCAKSNMKLDSIGFGTTTDADGTQKTLCSMVVDAKGRFPFLINTGMFDMNSYFSGKVSASAFTEHTDMRAYSIIHMDAPHGRIDQSVKRPLGFNERDVAVLPAYGFFYTAVAGETKNPTPYGAGLAPNLYPDNFFSLNHYHLKKTDIEYVVQTGKDVCNNAWHPGRLIDGKWYSVSANSSP